MLLLSFATYDPHDPTPWFSTGAMGEPRNWIGRYGAFISELFVGQAFGVAAFVLPLGLLIAGWRLLWREELDAAVTKSVGLLALVLSLAAFSFIAFKTVPFSGEPIRAGGAVGESLASFLGLRVGRFGSIVVLGLSLFAGIILTTQFSFSAFLSALTAWIGARLTNLRVGFTHWRETRRKDLLRQQVIKKHAARTPQTGEDWDLPQIDPAEARFIDLPLHEVSLAEAPLLPQADVVPPLEAAYVIPSRASLGGFDPLAASLARPSSVVPLQTSMIEETASNPDRLRRAEVEVEAPSRGALRRRREPLPLAVRDARSATRRGRYALPPLSLLDATVSSAGFDRAKLADRARLVEAKCKEFGVAGAIVEIHPGPVVTTYEFKPDAGVKYAKVVSLADDLALALEAESVRIDRMGGRGTVGIEIPNEEREMIGLRQVLDSDLAEKSSARLLIGLGKNVAGDTYIADLATMPHLLIAGATGTGKSVGLNCIIASLLFHTTPDECRLIMIDPKRLELGVYENIPHLLAPVVTEPKLAANVLKWAVGEMDKRTRILAAEGVRNIEQFNNIIKSDGLEESGLTPLHYIVIVIDELADLMMVSSKDVEESITRLAQMARAVGIHLILATQRPSVDVITGLIKANFPARISFRVSARVDSRTILDASGAEQLLGRGDMLFLPPQSSRLVRVHGAFVSEKEIARVTEFLRTTGGPSYDTTVGKTEPTGAEKARAEDRDDLFDECARLVVEQGQASTSMLQRRFRIGFSRAGRLIDLMEQDGIIGPADGARPREILVPKNYFGDVDSRQT
jgi:S-DNA-T family DNA segregation ATPase FtsK/SpoIIIE